MKWRKGWLQWGGGGHLQKKIMHKNRREKMQTQGDHREIHFNLSVATLMNAVHVFCALQEAWKPR